MPQITFVDHTGQERILEVQIGHSVMEVGVKNGVAGIDADCGGACASATCHVYVEPTWHSAGPRWRTRSG